MGTLTLGLLALGGCSGSRLEGASLSVWGSDLSAVGPAGYNVAFTVFGDSACQGLTSNPSFTTTLDGAPISNQDCIAGAQGLLDNRTFTIAVHDGSDTAEIVVADLFPGLSATVVGPAGAPVTAGSTFDVTVPTELQFETPVFFGAQFTYLDANDPSYLGDVTNPTPTPDPGIVQVVAPAHAGHFALWISMGPPFPTSYPNLSPRATILSCSGLSSCTAFGAPDIGPLAVEVVAPAPASAN